MTRTRQTQTYGAVSLEVISYRKDGSVLNCSWSARKWDREDSDCCFGVLIQWDVTERRMAQQRLKENEERLNLVLSSLIGYAVVTLDVDGNVLDWNEEAEQLKGWAQPEIVGRDYEHFYPLDERQSGEPRAMLADARDKGRSVREGWRMRADGTSFWAEVVITPIFDPNTGGLQGFAKVTWDRSEAKAAETERVQAEVQKQRTHKMEALGALASGVAHDLNNILTAIAGYTEVIDLSDAEGEYTESTRGVLDATARARDLVGRILAFSRRSERRPVNLEVVSATRDSMRLVRAALSSQVVIDVDAPDERLQAWVDGTDWMQVLLNLCSNARDAIEDVSEGRIKVSLSSMYMSSAEGDGANQVRDGACILLEVSDNGCGMDDALMSDSSRRFFTTKEEGKGTGLGLSIVKDIVRSWNGELRIESEIGKGTKISILCPRHLGEVAPNQSALPSSISPKADGEKVLVADPDEAAANIMGLLLTRSGYQPLVTNDPLGALRAVAEGSLVVDVILLDEMWEMLSADLLEKLAKLCPVVALSSGPVLDNSLPWAQVERLSKPFTGDQLATAVSMALTTSCSND